MPNPHPLPQVLLFQEFNEVPAEITNPLRAWLVGPNAQLHRYAIADEKQSGLLGSYDYLLETSYAWPHKTAGSLVDQDYTKVFIDDAKLRYFQNLIGSGGTITPVATYANRISAASVNFKSVAGFDRSASLLDRDVAIGDLVYLRGSFDGDQDELWTYVRGVTTETAASEVATAVQDDNNATTTVLSAVATQVGGAVNLLELIVDTDNYSALVDGNLTDTYLLTVTGGSVDGDLRTATFRLETSSHVEYLTGQVPAIAGDTAEFGIRGLKLGWDTTGESAELGADEDDLIVGQQFQVVITQAFSRPVATSGGDYVGSANNTYVVTVASGGLFADTDSTKRPRVNIHTSLGTDSQQNVVVTGLDVAVPLGAGGATLTFSGSSLGLRKGDRYYVDVTAASAGRASTLILGHGLSEILQNATDLDLELFLKRDVQIPEFRTDITPIPNWVTSATELTLSPDIVAFDDSWTDNGVAQPLPVIAGTVYVEYREWLSELVNEVGGGSDISDADDIPGPMDPDNPLKWAFSKAVANSNGTSVRYTSVSDPSDVDAWTHALGLGTDRNDLYSLVPLTTDQAVLDLFVSHINSMSSESYGRWRKLFIALTAEETSAVVSATLSSDTDEVLATITDDPTTSGTQYTLVTVTSGNASLLELNVQAGDLLRVDFAENEMGETVYEEFVIDEVVGEDSVRLVSGPSAAISVAQKIEIWHVNSKSELVTQLGVRAGAYNNRRVCAVWPDVTGSAGTTYPGYHMCASLAGLASGVVPHQHLTNVTITGHDDLTRTTKFFTAEQLNDLAAYGVWIVTQLLDGSIVTRDALTTDMTSLQSRTEMVVRNVDSISYLMLSRLQKYIGRANVVPSAMDQIRIELISAIEYLKSNGFTARLGSQLNDAEIIELRQHVIQKDRVVVAITLDIPFPLNILELHLVA